MAGNLRNGFSIGVALAAALVVAGCGESSSLPSIPGVSSLFGPADKPPLPGTRVSVLSSETTASTNDSSKEPVVLPAQQQNASWSQPGGNASNAPGHLAYSGEAKTIWTEDAGAGSSSDGRITALPIVHGGKVFTLDREGRVSAFSLNGGRAWRVDLQPENEKADAGYGGGMAADGERLFVATGFGTVVALDTGSGKAIWTKSLQVPIRTSPTVANGKVFVVNTDSELYALSAENGQQLWTARGLPEGASVLSNVSPAVSGTTLVVSYSSGEVTAIDTNSGQQRWTDSITGGVTGSGATSIGDAARPVIDDGVVFAASRSGRVIATNMKSGERVWSKDIRAAQTPWVAGGSVFVVDMNSQLYALDRKSGKTRWSVGLPSARSWSGPTLAGGKLWVASNKGLLVGVDARTGEISTKRDLDTPVYISPIVAGGRMFVLTDKAKLIAMN
ncbi:MULTISPECIES: PQQ-binding-like beta-propeller repeat protein [Rhodomicrobium]|uniref:outer membrane protein assembly factor BamB family protein n=1 Tax=Rhodomicrobium TaxID=1068 RepID=UPI000B4C1BAB|nr:MULTISPECIES: PQQ-binding-like beta-propeller repeat protein [Rhodomicrobium]